MKKAIWLLLLALLLGCSSTNTINTQPADTNTEENTAVTSTEETAENVNPAPAAANLDDFVPAKTVEEAAVVREQDWRKGAADPTVVIIEYGDFQ